MRRWMLLGLLVPLLAGDRALVERSPNVLLISIDTLRSDHLSCYGYHRRTSPNLDAFAEDGALFENAYAQAPFTLTSHMSMFTSLWPESHGVEEGRRLSSRAPTITELLTAAGYTAAGFHNAKWLNGVYGFARGFDRYTEHESGEETLQEVLATLPTLIEAEAPFFLFVHLMEVHCGLLGRRGEPIYNAPARFRQAFLPHPTVEVTRHLNLDVYNDRVQLTPEEQENIVAQYDGGILYADWLVGQILEKIKELGLYEPMLIIVTSDHGESLGDHGVFKGHGLFWENGLRVPLLVKLPRSHRQYKSWRGQRLGYRVQSVDIAPTILSVAGLAIPPSFQGRTLLEPGDRVVLAQRLAPGKVGVRSMIDGRYKLTGGWHWRLYDLGDDPTEEHSLSAERPQVLRDMKAKLRALSKQLQRTNERLGDRETDTSITLDEASRQRLKELGYLN